ncbi:MAG: hypothetical protein PHU98_06170 [Mariniphaga sp.]|nr:hypothetical protein [Mariniphaga sp.]
MSVNTTPTCPTGCIYVPPSNDFDFCKSNIHQGEIEILYIAGPSAQCFTSITSLAEWNARLSETSVDPDTIRRFRVIGDMPAASSTEVPISLGQFFYTDKDFLINIEVEDNSDLNYAFMRWMECQQLLKIWYQTAGGDLFGGICGIDVSVAANYVIEKGQKSIHKQMWTLKWVSKFSPERVISPLV